MRQPTTHTVTGLVATTVALLLSLPARPALAHCDTLDGPTVADARAALQARDVTPALKWVAAPDEAAVRAAFARTLEVRALGAAARELADTFFLETVVRLHRASEGMPFQGLRPSGTPLEPGVALADAAVAAGDNTVVAATVAGHVAAELGLRFEQVVAARAHAAHNVEAGRRYVAAYVSYVHFVEGLLAPGGHDAKPAASPAHVH